jgi:hypothetical protein
VDLRGLPGYADFKKYDDEIKKEIKRRNDFAAQQIAAATFTAFLKLADKEGRLVYYEMSNGSIILH